MAVRATRVAAMKTSVHWPYTRSGARLQVLRCSPWMRRGSRRHAIVLWHGLGLSSLCFHFCPDGRRSVVEYLVSDGWEVWTPSMRGAGQSDRTSGLGFADALDDAQDVVEYVAKTTKQRVHWVGHSLGAMMLCAALARSECARNIRSGVLVAGSIYLEQSSLLQRLLPLWRWMPHTGMVPSGWIKSRFVRWLTHGALFATAPAHTPPSVRRDFLKQCVQPLPLRMVDDLSTGLRSGGMVDPSSGCPLGGALARSRCPLLLIAGEADRVMPVGTMRELFENTSASRLVVAPHLGHVDVITGESAAQTVWAEVAVHCARYDY